MNKVSVNVTALSRQEGWERRSCLNNKAQTTFPNSSPALGPCLGEPVAPVLERSRDVKDGLVQQRLFFSVGL